MTDILKDEAESKSYNIWRKIKSGEIDVVKHASFFTQEMEDIGANDRSLFILLGVKSSIIARIFNEYLKADFPNVIYCPHYSYFRMTDAQWVYNTWTLIITHYRKTRVQYNTPRFRRNTIMKECLINLRRKAK